MYAKKKLIRIEKWERACHKTDWDRKRDGKGRGLAQELSTLSTCGENGLTKLYFTLDTHIIKPENIFHKTDTLLRENEKSCKKRCFFVSIFCLELLYLFFIQRWILHKNAAWNLSQTIKWERESKKRCFFVSIFC